MFSSFESTSSTISAIAQMDSIIHHRMTNHIVDFCKESTDWIQHEMDICDDLSRINIGVPHKHYSKALNFNGFASRYCEDYSKADYLSPHVLGSIESYCKNKLTNFECCTKNKNPLNCEDREQQYYDLTVNKPCLDQDLSYSEHCILKSVGDVNPLNLSKLFRFVYPNQFSSVDTNHICIGSLSYSSQRLVEAINTVCHGSVLYPNSALSERKSTVNCSVFLNSCADTYSERNGFMVYINQATSLELFLNNISSNRRLSVENPICIDSMIYVNRSLNVLCSMSNHLMFYSNRVFREDVVLYNVSMMYPNKDSSLNNQLCNCLMFRDEIRSPKNGRAILGRVNFCCKHSFILEGQSLRLVAEKGQLEHGKGSRGRKRRSHTKNMSLKCKGRTMTRLIQNLMCKKSMVSQIIRGTLLEFRGYVYLIAKNQIGCLFLQMILEEGNHHDIQVIFNETINHMAELIMDPFANHLIQKLLSVCGDEQITQIVLKVTAKHGRFITICFNTHGTRVLQKLIKSLNTRQQQKLVVSALQRRFLELVKDENGYHIIKSCLQFLSKEDTKFIFEAASKCRVGYYILKSCIAQSVGKFREKMVTEIASEGFDLAQDAFGNYVIQHIIELNIPSAAVILSSQFHGNYVYLSTQKFSSYVVQTFLKSYKQSLPIIIQELLSVPHFDHLLKDPFANYVIQTAVDISKGPLHDLLVEAVQSHSTALTSPYFKKIFLGNLLEK
uniref:PumT n=1 Tax=Primula veris TaxID=170927 RepID=A0A3Q8GZE7_PRIVE|nr:PumT [Primula veris]